jgi:hypothetical protein
MYRMISCGAAFLALSLVFCMSNGTALADDFNTCRNVPGDSAIAACSRVLRRNPTDATAYARRGDAHNLRGGYDHAIADYDRALAR